MRWMWIFLFCFGSLQASEVLIHTEEGQTYLFNVHPEESRGPAIQDDENFIVAVVPKKKVFGLHASNQGRYLGYPRNYHAEVSEREKEHIRFIITSLADKSLIAIAFIKGDLESAGDQIDHIHPLRFLMTVFTDEEMKVGMRNIRGRGWIWGQFLAGLKECLNTEMHIGNIKEEYINDFSAQIELAFHRIYPFVHTHDWDGLIEVLINEIPRKGDHDRYDS